MNSCKSLESLYSHIKKSNLNVQKYFVPRIWLGEGFANDISNINPKEFFLMSIEKIINSSFDPKEISFTTKNPMVYCLLLRYTTTFDHNRDQKISLEPIDDSLYETGTFLKTICILPYLKMLGVDIIYLLPICEIGKFGRKGILGSPYAYKHPFKLDHRLGEPFLTISLEEQFKAFVEACHLLGIKVVLEFVLRTISIDNELALDHPDWFYWIREEDFLNGNYKPPRFSEEQLAEIIKKVEAKNYEKLIPPEKEYLNMFTEVPEKVFKIGERIVGILNNGERVTIPYAFADWPPNDVQPLWTDVTYFRYYDHPDFNYISYNTVRMYSQELIEKGRKVEDLWQFVSNVIPYYIDKFDIDGAMIDMGHAIPEELLSEIISKARERKENFIFWEENFNVTEKSKEDGYDATLGYYFFDQAEPNKVKNIITKLEKHMFSLPFFLAPETHNTPRSARLGNEFNQLCAVFNSFLPGIRFILSGFEFCHKIPYNTGLAFTEQEIQQFPPEKLPLYSPVEFDWQSENICNLFANLSELVKNFGSDQEQFENYSLKLIETNNHSVVCYRRKTKDFEILVFGNFSSKESKFQFEAQSQTLKKSEVLLGEFCLSSEGFIILQPYGYLVLKILSSS